MTNQLDFPTVILIIETYETIKSKNSLRKFFITKIIPKNVNFNETGTPKKRFIST